MKLPVHQAGAVGLHSGPMGTILLSAEFHHLLAEDAANRGEMDKATAHEVLASAVGAEDAAYATVAPQLFPGSELDQQIAGVESWCKKCLKGKRIVGLC